VRQRRSVGRAIGLAAAIALAGLWWLWYKTSPSSQSARTQSQLLPSTNAVSTQPGLAGTNAAQGQAPAAAAMSSGQPRSAGTGSNSVRGDNLLIGAEKQAGAGASHFPRPVQNVFEMQVALAREGLSCGSIDGLIGPQTRAALESFQRRNHLAVTGELDSQTGARLLLGEAPTGTYEVASNDLARLQPVSPTWLGKSMQSALDYESLLELVSEKAQSNPLLVRRLNPDLDWGKVAPGTTIEIPKITFPPPSPRAAFVTIQLRAKILEAWDGGTNLLAHFPCSIARQVEKRPIGELHVAVIAYNPNYTFAPENFPESAEARELGTKLLLPPGPNNPVGTAWIGLDKPGYGIHGTPWPEKVGRTESHGCFRLANWNADYLARLVEIGTPIYVEP